jgi:thiaminase
MEIGSQPRELGKDKPWELEKQRVQDISQALKRPEYSILYVTYCTAHAYRSLILALMPCLSGLYQFWLKLHGTSKQKFEHSPCQL